jgi:expansin (peptidoglycan-binding protein)
MTAAINMPMIDNSLSCGMCAIVKYKDKKETVLLDNLCPECKYGDLDLSNQAWEKLTGNKNYGREKITWDFANCDKFIKPEKNGVVLTPHHINYWWLSITPSNFKCGINNMFIMFKDKGSWIEMERKNSNMNGLYFIYHAHVQGEFKFKVLSKFDEEIETDWYSEIKEEWTLGKQFKCEQAVDCGDFSTYINTEPTPSLRGSNGLNCTN